MAVISPGMSRIDELIKQIYQSRNELWGDAHDRAKGSGNLVGDWSVKNFPRNFLPVILSHSLM